MKATLCRIRVLLRSESGYFTVPDLCHPFPDPHPDLTLIVWGHEPYDAKFSEKCPYSHNNNTAFQIFPFDTANSHDI